MILYTLTLKEFIMFVRNTKERVFGAPARALAEFEVSPNTVTLVGLLLNLFAETVALKAVETQKSSGIFWLATLARVLALAADGLDGSVARARKKTDPDYTNPYGSYIDGGIDRLVNTLRMMVESQRFAQMGNQSTAILAALTGVMSNLPSYLRAETEARGGVTTEQSLNLLEFAGTHAGRTAINTLISLEYSQVNQIVAGLTGGKRLRLETWDMIKQFLIAYVALSTAVVSVKRFGALRDASNNVGEVDRLEQTTASPTADSAGFQDKNLKEHQNRAKLYFAMLLTSVGVAAALLGSQVSRNRKQLNSRH